MKYNNLQISLDGTIHTHEKIRKKDGCFNLTVNNFKILDKYKVPININFTVMNINYSNIGEFLEYISQFNIASVRFVRVIPSGRGESKDLLLSAKEYRELCLLLKDKSDTYKNTFNVKIDESFLFLERR